MSILQAVNLIYYIFASGEHRLYLCSVCFACHSVSLITTLRVLDGIYVTAAEM